MKVGMAPVRIFLSMPNRRSLYLTWSDLESFLTSGWLGFLGFTLVRFSIPTFSRFYGIISVWVCQGNHDPPPTSDATKVMIIRTSRFTSHSHGQHLFRAVPIPALNGALVRNRTPYWSCVQRKPNLGSSHGCAPQIPTS